MVTFKTPELIPSFINKWKAGHEAGYAVRTDREESLLKRLAYTTCYRSLSIVAEVPAVPHAGDFSLLDRQVVDILIRLRERDRFLRGLRSWVGFKQAAITYQRPARLAGAPKYTL